MTSDPANLTNITLAILAGGEGSRMGYAKGEMRLGGRPILRVLAERLAWPGPTLLVTAPGREHPTGWELFTREVTDPTAGQGPLRGVLTALESATTPIIVMAAVDMPRVGCDQFRWVATELLSRCEALGVMPRRQTEGRGQVQPFPCAIRVEAAPLLRGALASGRRALHRLLDDAAFVAVDVPADWDDALWLNLNTVADLDSFGGWR